MKSAGQREMPTAHPRFVDEECTMKRQTVILFLKIDRSTVPLFHPCHLRMINENEASGLQGSVAVCKK